jgi:hypothetical protein
VEQITNELADLFPDTLLVNKYTGEDAHGSETWNTGTTLSIKCRIVGRTKIVTDSMTGQDAVSSVQATTKGSYNLSTRDKFTLPERFSTNPLDPSDLESRIHRALAIDRYTDESGEHHEVVQFSNARIRTF